MVVIVPFQPEHLAALRLQGAQAANQAIMTAEHGHQIAGQTGLAYTAMIDGEPIACAGVIEIWQGRAYAWAYLSETALQHFRAVHRAVLSFLAGAAERWPRIEMAVHVNHLAAKRWAFHLGFELAHMARKWTPTGHDVELWERVT